MKSIIRFLALIVLLTNGAVAFAQIPVHHTKESSVNGYNFVFGATAAGTSERAQGVYKQSDFVTGPVPKGFITSVWFRPYNGSAIYNGTVTMSNFTVSLGNTSLTQPVGGSWTAGTNAFGPGAVNISWVQGVWFEIPLTTPFYYDGSSNLLVDLFGNTAAVANKYPETDNAPAGSIIYGSSTSVSGSIPYLWNLGLTVFPGYPCTDTPKTSIKWPKRVCPNKQFSIFPDSAYSDATYSWEYSDNGLSWAKYTGIPGLYGDISDVITKPRWYRTTITCINNTNLKWTTPAHKVDISPFYYCYCNNTVTLDNGSDIGGLVVMKYSNDDTVYDKTKLTTGKELPVYSNSTANKRYTSYHDSLGWPCLYKDTTYKFIITQTHPGASFSPGVAQVYIDYNRDGLYNPNTERVLVKALDGTGTPAHILNVTAKVPTTAEIGVTGMRVIVSADTVKIAPCDSITGAGEVEDYIVEICHRPCDSMVPAGLVASTDTSMCTGYEYKLTDTTFEKERSAFTLAWQVSGDDLSWFNIANSQGKDTLQRVFTGQPLFYRLRTICLPTSDTNYSVSTRINVKPGYKCYCYSKAIGLTEGDTSDIGGVTISTYVQTSGGPHLLNATADRPRTDFTDITPIELYTDSVYKFSVYHTMPVVEHGDAKITVFMDFNNDNDYDIPEERVYTGYSAIGNHTLIDNILVPLKAVTDVPTGMRIILNNDVGPNIPSDSACGPYTSGETEDYLVVFRKQWAEGVANTTKLSGFNITPNPTSGKFHIRFSTNQDISEVKVKITGVTGQLIQEGVYEHKGGMFYHEVDMGQKAKGVYFVELEADGDKLVRKLIVQ